MVHFSISIWRTFQLLITRIHQVTVTQSYLSGYHLSFCREASEEMRIVVHHALHLVEDAQVRYRHMLPLVCLLYEPHHFVNLGFCLQFPERQPCFDSLVYIPLVSKKKWHVHFLHTPLLRASHTTFKPTEFDGFKSPTHPRAYHIQKKTRPIRATSLI